MKISIIRTWILAAKNVKKLVLRMIKYVFHNGKPDAIDTVYETYLSFSRPVWHKNFTWQNLKRLGELANLTVAVRQINTFLASFQTKSLPFKTNKEIKKSKECMSIKPRCTDGGQHQQDKNLRSPGVFITKMKDFHFSSMMKCKSLQVYFLSVLSQLDQITLCASRI